MPTTCTSALARTGAWYGCARTAERFREYMDKTWLAQYPRTLYPEGVPWERIVPTDYGYKQPLKFRERGGRGFPLTRAFEVSPPRLAFMWMRHDG